MDLQLTQSSLEEQLNNLKTVQGQLETNLQNWETAFQTLDAAWDGDAQEAFRTTYNELHDKYAQIVSSVVPKYITALEKVINTYSENESKNANLFV